MAMRLSVTVSIAEARSGRLMLIERVMRERISASDGMISEWPGVSRTSSNVRASGKAEGSTMRAMSQLSRAGTASGDRAT